MGRRSSGPGSVDTLALIVFGGGVDSTQEKIPKIGPGYLLLLTFIHTHILGGLGDTRARGRVVTATAV